MVSGEVRCVALDGKNIDFTNNKISIEKTELGLIEISRSPQRAKRVRESYLPHHM